VCYSWEVGIGVGFDVMFNRIYDRREIWKNSGEFRNTKTSYNLKSSTLTAFQCQIRFRGGVGGPGGRIAINHSPQLNTPRNLYNLFPKCAQRSPIQFKISIYLSFPICSQIYSDAISENTVHCCCYRFTLGSSVSPANSHSTNHS
jgi:hypothetical protein